MGTNEQARRQIAEAREALKSAAAARRAARTISTLAVLVGLVIVAFFVWTFINPFLTLSRNPAPLEAAARKRIDQLQIRSKVQRIAKDAAPAFVAEGRALVQSMDLPKVAKEQLTAMVKDLEPVFKEQALAARPQVQELLRTEGEKMVTDLRQMLQDKLSNRLAEMVTSHTAELQQQTGLNEKNFEVLVSNLQASLQQALRTVVEKRIDTTKKELAAIRVLAEQVPPLPGQEKMAKEDILAETGRVLLALIKENLPEYDVTAPVAPSSAAAPAGPTAPSSQEGGE